MNTNQYRALKKVAEKDYTNEPVLDGKVYLTVLGNDECLDDTPFVYAISKDNKDSNLYKLYFDWSATGKDSEDASDWVDDWEKPVRAEIVDEDDAKDIIDDITTLKVRIYPGNKAKEMANNQPWLDLEVPSYDIDTAYDALAENVVLKDQSEDSKDLIDFQNCEDDDVETMLKDLKQMGFIDYDIEG